MSASRVESASEIVDVGEQVWIKVIGREVTTHTQTHTSQWSERLGRVLTGLSLHQIRGDKVKLSFSMKAVNQGTGRDLDPNNVMAEWVLLILSYELHACLNGYIQRCTLSLAMFRCRQDSRRRRQFRDHTGNRITLEAVLNTTCSKCGCKGMLTKGHVLKERRKCMFPKAFNWKLVVAKTFMQEF